MTSYTKTMMESLAEVRGLQENNMDLMRKAAGGAMQTLKMKDGKLQMDSFTASAIMQVFDKVNPANQKKMEQMINDGKKSGIIKLQKFAMSKVNAEYSEELELDEGGMKRQLMKVSDFITTLINQGGMDKSDYEAARGYVEDGNMKGLAYMVKKLDTEPRDMIINAVAKGLGKKQAEQIFKVSIRRVEEVDLDEKKGSAGASLKDVMALDKKHAAHKKQSKKDQKRRDANRASNRAAGMEEVEIDEAKPEFEVKYAKSKAGPFKVTKFMTLDQAKEFLADVKKDGMNGIISKGGKPVKEETILERIDRKLKERKNG